jgi:hypothetical protein
MTNRVQPTLRPTTNYDFAHAVREAMVHDVFNKQYEDESQEG